MGQQEVFNFLKNNKDRWWSSKEIAAQLSASVGSVTTTLTKLRKRNEVRHKMSPIKTNMYLYKYIKT